VFYEVEVGDVEEEQEGREVVEEEVVLDVR
jgi:hypothetical protein